MVPLQATHTAEAEEPVNALRCAAMNAHQVRGIDRTFRPARCKTHKRGTQRKKLALVLLLLDANRPHGLKAGPYHVISHEQIAGCTNPAGHGRARDLDSLTGIDLRLPEQWQAYLWAGVCADNDFIERAGLELGDTTRQNEADRIQSTRRVIAVKAYQTRGSSLKLKEMGSSLSPFYPPGSRY